MSFGISRGKEMSAEGFGLEMDDVLEMHRQTGDVIDPREWFAHPERPFEIEIGSGKGTFLVQEAPLHRETNFLGIEWTSEFYRYAADRFRRHALDNARMLRADATEFIGHYCTKNVASVVHLYFSDPWPKKRHHKRRVIQDATLRAFHEVLQTRGELRIVTDHDDLWAWTEEHAARHADLFERCAFDAPESAKEGEVVGTNFERKYQREGRPFHAMTLVKKS